MYIIKLTFIFSVLQIFLSSCVLYQNPSIPEAGGYIPEANPPIVNYGVSHSHDGIKHSHVLSSAGLNHTHERGYGSATSYNNGGASSYTDRYGGYGNDSDSQYDSYSNSGGYYDAEYGGSDRDSYYDNDNSDDNKRNSRAYDHKISQDYYPKFPWRPPLASAMETLPSRFFKGASSLEDIDARISNALIKSGYGGRRYYSIPSGFVITTRIEKISRDGISKKSPYRWQSEQMKLHQEWSLGSYFKSLLTANIGYYRVFVFSVTSEPFVQSKEIAPYNTINTLALRGANRLQEAIKNRKYTNKYAITAHVYAFKKPEFGKPIFLRPSNLTGREHLMASTIISGFR